MMYDAWEAVLKHGKGAAVKSELFLSVKSELFLLLFSNLSDEETIH